MGMFAVSKYLLKEWTWRSQDYFVCLYLLATFTCQGHISEILVISQASKSTIGILLEVIPLQTEFFWHHNKRDFPNCSNDLHNYSCFVGKGLCDVDLMKGILQSLEEIQLLLSNFHTLLFHKMHCHNKSCVRQVCFHLYLQKNSKMTIIIIIQLPFKIFWLHNQESRLWCRQGSHLSVERVPAASWLGTRFQVSHGYFMKYYMMGLLQMPNIMSSIEADRLICWKLDILSH